MTRPGSSERSHLDEHHLLSQRNAILRDGVNHEDLQTTRRPTATCRTPVYSGCGISHAASSMPKPRVCQRRLVKESEPCGIRVHQSSPVGSPGEEHNQRKCDSNTTNNMKSIAQDRTKSRLLTRLQIVLIACDILHIGKKWAEDDAVVVISEPPRESPNSLTSGKATEPCAMRTGIGRASCIRLRALLELRGHADDQEQRQEVRREHVQPRLDMFTLPTRIQPGGQHPD